MMRIPKQHFLAAFTGSEQIIPVVLIGLSIFLSPVLVSAQYTNTGFEEVPIEVDGIQSVGVNAIVQDHQGYLWINTLEGLARYDGYEFKLYKNIPGDSTSILSDDSESLHIDHDGTLWLGTNIGISRYEPHCDCFSNYPLDAADFAALEFGLLSNGVGDITSDKNNNLWVAVQGGGLLRYDRENDQFVRYLDNPEDPNSLTNDIVRHLLADRQGNIWIGTGFGHPDNGKGLVRFNPVTGQATRFKHEPENPNSLLDNRISALLEDRQGRIWVGTYQCGLHYFDPQREEFVRMMPDESDLNRIHAPMLEGKIWQNDPFVSILYQDRKGGFWVGTNGKGLNYFDGGTGQRTFYAPSTIDDPFKHYWVLEEDRYGQIWLGTIAGGLYKKDLFRRNFQSYPEFRGIISGCESKTEPGVLWLGSLEKGLIKFDVNSGEFFRYPHDKNKANSIGDNSVRACYEDRDNNLWLGLGAASKAKNRVEGIGGLDRLDKSTGVFQHYPIKTDPADEFNETVFSICEDKYGYLWLGTGPGGLFRSDGSKSEFNRYYLQASRKNQIPADTSIYFVQEAGGHLWAASHQGPGTLYRYDYDKDQFFLMLTGFKTTFITEDHNGWLWIGTRENQGLIHLNPLDFSYQQYTTKDGLPGNGGTYVVAGDDGLYWVSTQNGLCSYDTKTEQFSTDGLPSHFFHPFGFKTRDGHIFLSEIVGLVTFAADQVLGNPFPPDLVLRELQISGEPFLRTSAHTDLRLDHDQNDFNFEYTGIHLADPAKNQYKYRLAPYDRDWISAGTQRNARYTNLDPGSYTFQVKSANSDGTWNKEGISVSFYIQPAWWTTWWAYLIYFTSIGGIIYGVYRFQLSKKLALEETKRLQEIDQLKTNLYTNITHEFRTPLTVILGMTDALQTNVEEQHFTGAKQSLEMIRRNGKNLLHLVNEMLDLAKLDSGHLELELICSNVIPFVKYLCESFQSLAAEKQVKLTVDANVKELEMDFDVQKLSVIVSNLLSNAVKFTENGGQVHVQLNRNQQEHQAYFLISVKDSGLGISTAEIEHIFDRFYQVQNSLTRQGEGTGIGLALTKELVELMNGTIVVNSTVGKGTEFILQIPVDNTTSGVKESPLPEELLRSTLFTLSPTTLNRQVLDTDLPLVLIIEDNADVAYYLKNCLEEQYRVLHAVDGLVGIQTAFAETPDVIICDVMMPGKDGYEVCATLKTDERTDHIPIIMLTAKVTKKDRLAGLAQGADAYLAKPFEKEELMIRLDKLMEVRKTLQKKYGNTLASNQSQRNRSADQTERFIEKTERIIIEHLEEEGFSIEELAKHLNLSRSQAYRKIKALTGMSTAIYIRFIRLQKAKELLAESELTISEIAYQVGFKSPVYFSQVFKETFGQSPKASRESLF